MGWQLPRGTLGYSFQTSKLYLKTGSGPTDWSIVNGGGGEGTVQSVSGDGVDNTDPANPAIDLTGVITTAMFDAGAKAPDADHADEADHATSADAATSATTATTATTAGTANAVAAHSVANAGLAQMAAHTFKGNNTGSTANALDLSATELTAELNVATSSLKGLLSAADFLKLAAIYLTNSGGALTNGDATIQPGTTQSSQYLAAVAETANRATTLGTNSLSSTTPYIVYILRTSTAAFTRDILNGGTNVGTLFTFPASQTVPIIAGFRYNGTDWVCLGAVWLSL